MSEEEEKFLDLLESAWMNAAGVSDKETEEAGFSPAFLERQIARGVARKIDDRYHITVLGLFVADTITEEEWSALSTLQDDASKLETQAKKVRRKATDYEKSLRNISRHRSGHK